MSNQILNQDIRFAETAGDNNPLGVLSFIKPSRIIITDGVPEQDEGELQWYAIDQNTGVLYEKTLQTEGQWQGIYQFSGGASPVDNAANVGAGIGWFLQKAGNLLEFKSATSIPSNIATESSLLIQDNIDEINITSPAVVSDLVNYGSISDYWIIDNDGKFQDANNNYIYPVKSLLPLNGIQIQTQTSGSDKYLEISNTGIINVVNAEVSPGDLVSVSNGVATVKALTAGPGINIQSNPTNLQISAVDAETPQYHFSYQNSISYSVLSAQYNNLPPFVSAFPDTTDWVFYPNINGSSFVQYTGSAGVVYKLNYNVSMASTLQTTQYNFLFRVAQGNPLISQSALPLSGTLIHCPASPSPIIYFGSTSTDILFEPTPNEYYTIQCQATLAPQQTLQVEEFKFVITKV